MNGLIEILSNRYWMIQPHAAHIIRKSLETNLNGHIALGPFNKKQSYCVKATGEVFDEYLLTADGETEGAYKASRIKEPFVNVMIVDGPVTRNGGACSYGSIDHRDMMFEASDNPNCRGHIFIINTPGGSAWAKNDYQQGIEYAHSKGLPVFAFVDGMCCSAGMYLAALCDKRFYMHPKNEIGCIGVMCAFYSEKDGEKNNFTNETYHEIYEPESYDKNKWVRDIANDGDDTLLIADLVKLGDEFRADVKYACPNATDEHIHGKTFSAEEVKGILVDEQSTFGDVVSLCFSTYENNHPTSNNSPMDEKYLPLANACGVDELVMTEEGTHLAMSLVDELTAKLNADAEALAAANQQIADCEQAIADLKASNTQNLADAQALYEKKLAEKEVSHAGDMAKTQSDNEQTLANLQTSLEQAQAELAAAQQTIANRDALIQELTAQAAPTPDVAPTNNGSGLETESVDSFPNYDSSLSPEENARIRNQWKAEHGI